jgi:hypothetical protein
MKIWKRRIILIIAFSLFFVVSPILVFYAMGYRYDFKNKAFRQIGMIILESKPDNADIFINGEYNQRHPLGLRIFYQMNMTLRLVKMDLVLGGKNCQLNLKKLLGHPI